MHEYSTVAWLNDHTSCRFSAYSAPCTPCTLPRVHSQTYTWWHANHAAINLDLTARIPCVPNARAHTRTHMYMYMHTYTYTCTRNFPWAHQGLLTLTSETCSRKRSTYKRACVALALALAYAYLLHAYLLHAYLLHARLPRHHIFKAIVRARMHTVTPAE